MTHEEHLVSELMSVATPMSRKCLALQPEERRQRLDGIEEMVAELTRRLEVELFNEVFEWLSERAEEAAGKCRVCGRQCQRTVTKARVRTKRHEITVEAVRYRCRRCGTSRSPIRE